MKTTSLSMLASTWRQFPSTSFSEPRPILLLWAFQTDGLCADADFLGRSRPHFRRLPAVNPNGQRKEFEGRLTDLVAISRLARQRSANNSDVNLSITSRQFKRLYRVTMRGYSCQVRLRKAETLLKDSNRLNINKTAGILGHSFSSAFSRCFQQTVGKRPKRYQTQRHGAFQQQTYYRDSV